MLSLIEANNSTSGMCWGGLGLCPMTRIRSSRRARLACANRATHSNRYTSDFNTQLAREMIDTCTATIFCYGETGAGSFEKFTY